MECICHVWVGAPTCYVDVWDELQKWVAKPLIPTLTTSLKPFPHLRNDEILRLHMDIIFEKFMRTCWIGFSSLLSAIVAAAMAVHHLKVHSIFVLYSVLPLHLNFSLLQGVPFHSMSKGDFKNVRQHNAKWMFNTMKDLCYINMINNNFLCLLKNFYGCVSPAPRSRSHYQKPVYFHKLLGNPGIYFKYFRNICKVKSTTDWLSGVEH